MAGTIAELSAQITHPIRAMTKRQNMAPDSDFAPAKPKSLWPIILLGAAIGALGAAVASNTINSVLTQLLDITDLTLGPIWDAIREIMNQI